MLKLSLPSDGRTPLHILCIGAHSDDIEIGCGGTLLTWMRSHPDLSVSWVVLTGDPNRRTEARRSAAAMLKRAPGAETVFGEFRDGFLVSEYSGVKSFFEDLKKKINPDVVLTHWLDDRHQDHRLAAELTWNTWRNHLILEYEIPKYEGDLKPTNLGIEIPASIAKKKVAHLHRYFVSQRHKSWFDAENFLAIMRIRGLEYRSASGFAEGFHARKLVVAP